MDAIYIISTLLTIVGLVLYAILFFKIWRMCNDVKFIKGKLFEHRGYAYGDDMKIFDEEVARAKKLIYCEQYKEATVLLLSLKYEIEKAKTDSKFLNKKKELIEGVMADIPKE